MKSRSFVWQRGFALATVLLVLLIMALIVAALLNGQRFAVRELRDVLNRTKIEQTSRNLHRTCLADVHNLLTEQTLSHNQHVDLSQPKPYAEGSCQVTVEANAITQSNQDAWPPRLRITSSSIDQHIEISDWRYPACINHLAENRCFTAPPASLTLKNNQGLTQTVTVQYLKNTLIQTAWRLQ